ncbi:signal peptidase I [Nitrosopumilus sp.]|uniref:signal peptidase I n=1 Tax=Nitrosopumilus sp. TaxID=2024843 RepID=UPI00242CF50B|nr:signal peptidase I [Nitrosopumilus sp.]
MSISLIEISEIYNPFYLVESGSMKPALTKGDIVFVSPVSFYDLKLGDIIIFKKIFYDINLTTIHRVIEINEIDGERVIKTKGDNNIDSFEGLIFL